MEWTNSNFGEVGNQLILPFFESILKVPNNALTGLSRTQRSLVREAFSSGEFKAKIGRRMAIWTPGCRILLVGMGKKEKLTHKVSRNTGARVMASLSKKRCKEVQQVPNPLARAASIKFQVAGAIDPHCALCTKIFGVLPQPSACLEESVRPSIQGIT